MSKTPQWHFANARELFESAHDAARDAERIRQQLAEIEDRSASFGGAATEPHASGTPDPERMQRRLNALMDQEETLQRRQDEDYRLIDLATWVLYGRDNETGLAVLVPSWWCDALWWHYLADETWQETGKIVGYSEQRCRQVRDLAFDTVDSWGIVATMQGRPLNDLASWERDRRARPAQD